MELSPDQQDRLKTIAKSAMIPVIIDGVALYIRRENSLGHARDYPAGSFIIDIVKETKEKAIRVSGKILNADPDNLELEIDESNYTKPELSELEEMFVIEQSD